MRLSKWHEKAPNKESLGDEVLAVLRPVLVGLGAEADAECWIAWGDEPKLHYGVLVPTVVGLIKVNVRPSDPEGPRAIARLIRWSKLSMTELGVDASVGRRAVGVQVEGLVIEGVDEEGDRICEFMRGLIAGAEGRGPTPVPIALVGGAGAAGAVVALPAAGQDAAGAAAAPAKATPAGATGEPRPPAAAHKQSSAPSPKIVPITSKAASRSGADAAASPPASAPEPLAAPHAPGPVAPPAPPAPPTPIAARAAAARRGEQPPAGSIRPVPDPEPEEPGLIGLRPVEEPPAEEPPKPRPWTP